METKFRSFSHGSKALFPISLPLTMLPWHQERKRGFWKQTGLMPTLVKLIQHKEKSYRSRFHSSPCTQLFLHLFSSQVFMESLFCARYWARTWEEWRVKHIGWPLFSLYLGLCSNVTLSKKLPRPITLPNRAAYTPVTASTLPIFLHSLTYYVSFIFFPIPCYNVSSMKVGLSLACSLLYPQSQEWCLAHSTHSMKSLLAK